MNVQKWGQGPWLRSWGQDTVQEQNDRLYWKHYLPAIWRAVKTFEEKKNGEKSEKNDDKPKKYLLKYMFITLSFKEITSHCHILCKKLNSVSPRFFCEKLFKESINLRLFPSQLHWLGIWWRAWLRLSCVLGHVCTQPPRRPWSLSSCPVALSAGNLQIETAEAIWMFCYSPQTKFGAR